MHGMDTQEELIYWQDRAKRAESQLAAMKTVRDEMAAFMERMIDEIAEHEDDPDMLSGHRAVLDGWKAVKS